MWNNRIFRESHRHKKTADGTWSGLPWLGHPPKNVGVRQLGWWHSQYTREHIYIVQMFQTTNQLWLPPNHLNFRHKKWRYLPISWWTLDPPEVFPAPGHARKATGLEKAGKSPPSHILSFLASESLEKLRGCLMQAANKSFSESKRITWALTCSS